MPDLPCAHLPTSSACRGPAHPTYLMRPITLPYQASLADARLHCLSLAYYDLGGIDRLILSFIRCDLECFRHLVDAPKNVCDSGLYPYAATTDKQDSVLQVL